MTAQVAAGLSITKYLNQHFHSHDT